MRIITNGKEHYDRDGILGAKGEADIDEALVDEYLTREPYFQLQPPKTTGRELFSDTVAQTLVEKMQNKTPPMSNEAIIATITRITAESIARAYEQFVDKTIDEIYLSGGGAYNPNIVKHLQNRFPKSRVAKLDDMDIPKKLDPSAKEAVLFAILGFFCICGRTVPLPADAETKEPAILGCIIPGQNYRALLQMTVQDPDFENRGVLGRIINK